VDSRGILPVGRVASHRGTTGEVTVRVAGGEAALWTGLGRVHLDGGPGRGTWMRVEAARAYRDRLVLKLEGVDDATAAAALKGRSVSASCEDAPDLPVGRYWRAQLVGARVLDAERHTIGIVEDVVPRGEQDLLVVVRADREPVLIPVTDRIVREVDLAAATIAVDLPAGLLDLDRPEDDAP
jgi:16S rRNA processing protein RimM